MLVFVERGRCVWASARIASHCPVLFSINCGSGHSSCDQPWPEGHLAVEMMVLEMSQLGWQCPPHTADHLSEAEPRGSIAAAPCCSHGLCCGTEGDGASSSQRRMQCERALEEAPRLCCAHSSEIGLV